MKRTILRFAIRIAFYPALYANRFMCALGIWHQSDWVDAQLAIGSLPSRRDLKRLKGQGVTAIVNMCEEYAGDLGTLSILGISQLHLPTLDYHCPKEADLHRGIQFIDKQVSSGGKVLVHCKAGRGRSAIMVLCYLMQRDRCSASVALRVLKQSRPRLARGIEKHSEVRAIERNVFEGRGVTGG